MANNEGHELTRTLVVLFLGASYKVRNPNLNFAPRPFVSYENSIVAPGRKHRISSIGNHGLLLTTDENMVDIDFQVVRNINDPNYPFNPSLDQSPDGRGAHVAPFAPRRSFDGGSSGICRNDTRTLRGRLFGLLK